MSSVGTSVSVQQICQSNGNNNLVPHSLSAHEIGQVPLTPLAQHQQALHQQLQLRFANSNNSGEWIFIDGIFCGFLTISRLITAMSTWK